MLGADAATAFTLAGIGDLYVTSTSRHSRNRTLGERLGAGASLAEATSGTVMVSEGVRAARMFHQRAVTLGTDVPFLSALVDLLDGRTDGTTCLDRMLHARD